MRLLLVLAVGFGAFSTSYIFAEHGINTPAQDRHSEVVASKNCSAAVAELKKAGYVIPSCPKALSKEDSSSILTADFPASAIFVKPHQPGQFLDVLDMIRAVRAAKLPVVINVMSFSGNLKELISREIPDIRLTEAGRVVQSGVGKAPTTVNLVSDPGTQSTFLHDFGKQLVTPSSGDWQFFTTLHDGNRAKSDCTPFGDFLKAQCGISLVIPPPNSKLLKPTSQGYGGNYLPISPKHVLTGGTKVGTKYETDTNQEAHLKNLNRLAIGHTTIDTSFLKVGHVDEVFAAVPVNRPPPCNIGYVMADAEMGWHKIRGTPLPKDRTSFHFPSLRLISEAHADIRIIGKRTSSPINCKHLKLDILQHASLLEAKLISEEQFNQLVFYDAGFIKAIEMITEGSGMFDEDKKTYPMYQKLLANKPPKYKEFFQQIVDEHCVGFSGIDRHTIERPGEPPTYLAPLKILNTKTIPSIMESNLKILMRTVVEKTGCSDPTIIRLPVIFESIDGKAESILPNSVNLVSLGVSEKGGHLLIPKSTSVIVDKMISDVFTTHGIESHFASSTSCHLLQGDHSCSTNVFRLCLPQQAIDL